MKLNMKNIDEILRYFPNKIYQIFFNLFQENSKIAEELQEYRNLVHDDSSGDQVMKEWTLKITASLDRLVSAAENEINSLIRQENEKENTDS